MQSVLLSTHILYFQLPLLLQDLTCGLFDLKSTEAVQAAERVSQCRAGPLDLDAPLGMSRKNIFNGTPENLTHGGKQGPII